jgi:nicotinamide-nucleotide amidase
MTLDALTAKAEVLLQLCREKDIRIVTAESCTGGLIAACLTAVPGSSDVLDRGFVTYSNEAKVEMIGVPAALIAAHGAVSAEVAEAMARGALERSKADAAVALTGVAGPGGGTAEKPVGLVHIGAVRRGGAARLRREIFGGDRTAVRARSVAIALELLGELL